MAKINTYEEFEREVQHIGFLPYFGLDDKTLFSLEAMTDNAWYDNAPDDPWRWRVRAAEEGKMAYGTFFLKKKGFIWQEMLPAMIAVRRENRIFEELYDDGLISRPAARVWKCFELFPEWAQTDLKREAGFGKGENSAFGSALTELQMKMLICISGQTQRINRKGEPYGWPQNLFCRIDARFPQVEEKELTPEEGLHALLGCIARAGDFPEKAALRLIGAGQPW